jgi:hypothetical protein
VLLLLLLWAQNRPAGWLLAHLHLLLHCLSLLL